LSDITNSVKKELSVEEKEAAQLKEVEKVKPKMFKGMDT